ncbi:hypothetical protein B0H66DRAFT_357758 [Apodospora peruviana]|uniref:CBM1 domain-containing protein n=1 Tax=Apodospora peruviana TaxID=516989 RepID=A0AAE0HW30_9PEZI|nr:hypothetical protein B0H66DRAFT_357758 [Apodospora peruviana]
MRTSSSLSMLAAAAAVTAQSTAGPYDQCGGVGFAGPTTCRSGYYCMTYNPYYAQCIPGTATTTTITTTTTAARTSSSSSPSPITTTTTTSPPATLSTRTSSTTTTPTAPGGVTVPSTLVSGWYWIRAVAPPNYHLYLQSSPSLSPGTPLITSGSSAGQFNIIDGQLVHYRGTSASPLYMNVENPSDKTQRKLRTWFAETKNSYGAFAFQGDTLTWSVSDIARPNTAAWLVCEGQQLFVNTGAYLYNTPTGCADQTIHSYGGSTADL